MDSTATPASVELTEFGNDPKAESQIQELVEAMLDEMMRRKRLARAEFALQATMEESSRRTRSNGGGRDRTADRRGSGGGSEES